VGNLFSPPPAVVLSLPPLGRTSPVLWWADRRRARFQGVPAAPRDLIGEWFSALEANGEDFTFRLGRYCAGMQEPEWYFLPHDRYDGLGGLAHVLRTERHTAIDLPHSAERPPSRFSKLLAALYCLLRRRSQPMRFRDEDPKFASRSRAESSPSAFAWALLTRAETEDVRDAARQRGVSLNAWLLWALARATLPGLVPKTGDFQWIVPVNMRGFAKTERDTDNAAWTLDVVFEPDASPEDVQSALVKELLRKQHWGTWELFKLLHLFKPETLRALARREMSVRKHGSFSNLGRLSPRVLDPTRGVDEWWMAFNPVLRSRPIGAACLTWCDKLALTLQLHPALSRDPRVAREWLARWQASLRASTQPNNVLTRSTAATRTETPGEGGMNGT
jgi:hypothetical protein